MKMKKGDREIEGHILRNKDNASNGTYNNGPSTKYTHCTTRVTASGGHKKEKPLTFQSQGLFHSRLSICQTFVISKES